MRLVLLLLLTISGLADNYYANPATGKMSNDGSIGSPWSTLDSVMFMKAGALNNGDTLLLYGGTHGKVSGIHTDWYIDTNNPLVIKAVAGETPIIREFYMKGGSGIVLDSLNFRDIPGYTHWYGESSGAFIYFLDHGFNGPCSNMVVRNCTFSSADDFSVYGKDSLFWADSTLGFVTSNAENSLWENNHFVAMGGGVNLVADDVIFRNNIIDGRTGDFLVLSGNRLLIENNLLQNFFAAVPGVHADGMQLFVVGHSAIRNNTIIHQADPDNLSYYGTAQLQALFASDSGIGYRNLRIENNVIVTNSSHGITLSSPDTCFIINNTVINRIAVDPEWGIYGPFVIANNVSAWGAEETPSAIHIVTNNIVTGDTSIYVNYKNFDFRAVDKNSPLVDAGSRRYYTSHDKDGVKRTSKPDIGAYEYPKHKLPNKECKR